MTSEEVDSFVSRLYDRLLKAKKVRDDRIANIAVAGRAFLVDTVHEAVFSVIEEFEKERQAIDAL